MNNRKLHKKCNRRSRALCKYANKYL